MLGSPAFGGELVDSRNPIADTRIAAPEHADKIMPIAVMPVRISLGSAGNRQRHAVVGVLHEYARAAGSLMARAGYPYFVARPEQFERVTTNRLARPPRFRKTIPNRQGIYRAPQYGQSGTVIEGG